MGILPARLRKKGGEPGLRLPACALCLSLLVFRRYLLRLRAGPAVVGNTEGLGVRDTSARGRELHRERAGLVIRERDRPVQASARHRTGAVGKDRELTRARSGNRRGAAERERCRAHVLDRQGFVLCPTRHRSEGQ